ncbi:MAG: UDP-N-acetylmuramoyl-L-alanyl-D-glutamate--2,6-diaminopimelate ligase [Hahellaceae bacterium]|nr:UDP-N-acetylmuramoyl-L-alanyl-D-glutamate--2,6-diaminopimelate ligase [Hahellaceae bacterium]MCP5169850.1 UDP-N-acetylmuramoyl-L-alanyl-D-glutamate--2,6-diaminopimelate ligase [Hahellaceae bacterium]
MELRSLNLSKLLKGLCELPSVLDCRVHGLTLDSRQVKRGDAFVALRGRSVDGTQYISDAIARGAVVIFRECAPGQSAGQVIEQGTVIEVHLPDLAGHLGVLSSRFYGDPSEMLQVIGVTGTNGKSSVSHFLAQVLCEAGFNTGVIGTLGYGFVDRLIPASHTTPDVLRTQSLLASLCAQQADAVVMEVSSHGLDQGRVDSVNIEGAIFTNLTRDHLDYHETMEAYGDAKRRLFERPELRFAVVNVDDAFGRVLQSRMAPGVALFTYGISSPAMISVIHVEYLAEGIHAEIATPLGRLRLESGLIGAFNLSNLLAVVAAAIAMGVEIKPLEKALTKLHPVLGRMQRIARPGQAAVVIDYAHTPDALDSALTALRPHTKGKIWCVFGCGGDRDTGKRALMGAIAEQKADVVIITNDNPRSEPSQQIIDHILSGLDVPENAIVEPDREKAIRYVVERAAHQDLILLAGKGHEDYQEVDGVRLPYSDIKVVQTIFGLGEQS